MALATWCESGSHCCSAPARDSPTPRLREGIKSSCRELMADHSVSTSSWRALSQVPHELPSSSAAQPCRRRSEGSWPFARADDFKPQPAASATSGSRLAGGPQLLGSGGIKRRLASTADPLFVSQRCSHAWKIVAFGLLCTPRDGGCAPGAGQSAPPESPSSSRSCGGRCACGHRR